MAKVGVQAVAFEWLHVGVQAVVFELPVIQSNDRQYNKPLRTTNLIARILILTFLEGSSESPPCSRKSISRITNLLWVL